MNSIHCMRLLLCLVFSMLLAGCGHFASAISHNGYCAYSGVKADLALMTDLDAIKGTNGLIVPLAIVDLPGSFVWDTFSLGESSQYECATSCLSGDTAAPVKTSPTSNNGQICPAEPGCTELEAQV